MTIDPKYCSKLIINMQKKRDDTFETLDGLIDVVSKKGVNTGITVFGQMVDQRNVLDAYDYVLDSFTAESLPDDYTIETAPFEVVVSYMEQVLDGLRHDLIQQAGSPHHKTGYDQNEAYFRTLADISFKVALAVKHDREDLRDAEKV